MIGSIGVARNQVARAQIVADTPNEGLNGDVGQKAVSQSRNYCASEAANRHSQLANHDLAQHCSPYVVPPQ